MVLRLTYLVCLVVALLSCEKQYLNDSKPIYVPVRMYLTNEAKDTSTATRFDYKYDSDQYLISRTKWVGGKAIEQADINYDQRRQLTLVVIRTPSQADSFFYTYDNGQQSLTVQWRSAIPGKGRVITYKYTSPPQDRIYFYPLSSLGRLVEKTDSSYENGSFSKKIRTDYFYSASSTYERDMFLQIRESFPGAPDVSTYGGYYRFNQKFLGNPFASVSPDFVELPEQLREPWPFIRNGFVDYYRLSAPSWANPEADIFEVSKNFEKTNLPEEIRRTLNGRRSGVITVEYFRFVYQQR